jgi:hypothetical protein
MWLDRWTDGQGLSIRSLCHVLRVKNSDRLFKTMFVCLMPQLTTCPQAADGRDICQM